MKYVYPAVFTKENNGQYSIVFNDLENCYTGADTLEEGIEMAEDVLSLVLYGYEKDGIEIPTPSKAEDIPLNSNEFVNYIKADTMVYRKMYNNKAVKKTLTIPEWLNEEALSLNINFSQVLQEALMQKIGNR